ncbi:MAG: hypothetical protein QF450_03970 [Rhodospirillales bacterium]|jgi:hypothetical protein|nr:hypothetical protein [Rhodospirillales bacterium]
MDDDGLRVHRTVDGGALQHRNGAPGDVAAGLAVDLQVFLFLLRTAVAASSACVGDPLLSMGASSNRCNQARTHNIYHDS